MLPSRVSLGKGCAERNIFSARFASAKNKVVNCQQARVPALGTRVPFKKLLMKAIGWENRCPRQNPKVSLLDEPGAVGFVAEYTKSARLFSSSETSRSAVLSHGSDCLLQTVCTLGALQPRIFWEKQSDNASKKQRALMTDSGRWLLFEQHLFVPKHVTLSQDMCSVASEHSIGLIDIKWKTFMRPRSRYVLICRRNANLFQWEFPACFKIISWKQPAGHRLREAVRCM